MEALARILIRTVRGVFSQVRGRRKFQVFLVWSGT